MNSSAAPVARPDEAAVLSEPKIQENDPAERKQRKLQRKMNSSAAPVARPDEAAVLSEPKIQENDPAERKQRKLQRKMNSSAAPVARPDEAAVLSEPKIQENDPAERKERNLERKMNSSAAQPPRPDEAAVLSEPNIQASQRKEQNPERSEGLISDAQLAANRANSLLSTGPTSPEGKAKSSLNAVKTGLTGRTVLLPADDAAAYQKHLDRFFNRYKPVGDDEHSLTQSLADTEWRLLRIPSLEMGIYALGHLELAARFENQDPEVRASLIQAQIQVVYEKQLRNIGTQEVRLRKHREKDLAELKTLQKERKQLEQQRMKQASLLYDDARNAGQPFDPAEFGFDFSIQDLDAYLIRVRDQAKFRIAA